MIVMRYEHIGEGRYRWVPRNEQDNTIHACLQNPDLDALHEMRATKENTQ